MTNAPKSTSEGRRKFLASLTGLAGASLAITIPNLSFATNTTESLTVKQVIDIILKEIPNAPFERTVDQLRSGSMDQQVTGIS